MSDLNSVELVTDELEQELDEEIQRGLLGQNVGLSNGLLTANKYLNNTQAGRIYLMGAESGIGKTTLVDLMVMKAVENALERDLPIKVFYFSFEISKKMKYLNWTCYIAGKIFGTPLTPDYILGKIPGKPITAEDLLIYNKSKVILREYMKHIIVFDREMTPSGVYNTLIKWFEQPSVGIMKRDAPKDAKKQGFIRSYKRGPKWSKGYVIGVMDHIALGIPEKGQTLKMMIDAISRNAVITRNLFDMSWFLVQQFNQELASSNRLMTKSSAALAIAPSQMDFGDSRYTYRDADVVMGLVSPAKYDQKTYKGYEMAKVESFLLLMFILKNRYGAADKVIPYIFDPITRIVDDMPHAHHDAALEEAYETIDKIRKTCQSFFPKAEDLH